MITQNRICDYCNKIEVSSALNPIAVGSWFVIKIEDAYLGPSKEEEQSGGRYDCCDGCLFTKVAPVAHQEGEI